METKEWMDDKKQRQKPTCVADESRLVIGQRDCLSLQKMLEEPAKPSNHESPTSNHEILSANK